ncbi:hypothetical protein MPSI1_000949 [Malassezia psittaci]|uniref:Coatomer subunit epsilon n=1 Tax=Malassezia psittaci TaxID=1821823 RepID=A0AAF0FCM0_9BASI|nr:hypothetical protein MPSI1_000949 [Malassezia psittaci]
MSVDSVTFEIQSLFYQNAFEGCILLAKKHAPNGVVDEESLIRLVYAARAAVALRDFAQARQLLGDEADSPVAMSVLLLADYLEAAQTDMDDATNMLEPLQSLLEVAEPGELASEIVRYNVSLALYNSGDPTSALECLNVTGAGTSRELECVALGVHILLAIHRPDLAEKEYLAARSWGDDSLLVQYMEAWIGLIRGGRSTQQAYYVYDELSQNSSVAGTPNIVPILVGRAAANAALGNSAKALADLEDAAAFHPENSLILENRAAISALDRSTSQETVDANDRYAVTTNISALQISAPNTTLGADYALKKAELEQAIAGMA